MKNKHTIHTCTLKVNSTCCLKNGHVMHVECLSKNKSKIQDHSPSITLSKLPFKMILVPKGKVLSHLTTLISWSYDDPTLVPSHPMMGLLAKSMGR